MNHHTMIYHFEVPMSKQEILIRHGYQEFGTMRYRKQVGLRLFFFVLCDNGTITSWSWVPDDNGEDVEYDYRLIQAIVDDSELELLINILERYK